MWTITSPKTADNLLHHAIKHNEEDRVEQLLSDPQLDVTATDSRGEMAIHCAARGGHLAWVKRLIERGSPVDPSNLDGQTPLWLAAQANHEALVRYLISRNANAFSLNHEGKNCLHCAAASGSGEVIEYLLGFLSPHQCQTLLQATDERERNVLHYAAEQPSVTLVELLLGQPSGHIDTQDKHGYTPLHIAARRGHADIMVLLLNRGASLHTVNINGDTPLSFARGWLVKSPTSAKDIRRKEMVQQLQETHLTRCLDKQLEHPLVAQLRLGNERLNQNHPNTKQPYLLVLEQTLAQEAPPAIKIYALLQLSESALWQKHYAIAARWAVTAAVLTEHFLPPDTPLHIETHQQWQRIVIRWVREVHQSQDPVPPFDPFSYVDKLATIRAFKPTVETIERDLLTSTTQYRSLIQEIAAYCFTLLGIEREALALMDLGAIAEGYASPYSPLRCAVLIKEDTPQARQKAQHLMQLLELHLIGLGETPWPLSEASPLGSGLRLDEQWIPDTRTLSDEWIGTPEALAMTHLGTVRHALTPSQHISGNVASFNDYQQKKTAQLRQTVKRSRLKKVSKQRECAKRLLKEVTDVSLDFSNPTLHVQNELAEPIRQLIHAIACYYNAPLQRNHTIWEQIDFLKRRGKLPAEFASRLANDLKRLWVLRLTVQQHYHGAEESVTITRNTDCYILDRGEIAVVRRLMSAWLELQRVLRSEELPQRVSECLRHLQLDERNIQGIAFFNPRETTPSVSPLTQKYLDLQESAEQPLLTLREQLQAQYRAWESQPEAQRREELRQLDAARQALGDKSVQASETLMQQIRTIRQLGSPEDERLQRLERQQALMWKEYEKQQHQLSEQRVISQSATLNRFYRQLQIKLNEYFVVCRALSTGQIRQEESHLTQGIIGGTSGCLLLAGELIPVPFANVAVRLFSRGLRLAYQRRHDKRIQTQAQTVSSLAVSFTEMEKIVELTARRLTKCYQGQINALTPAAAGDLADYAVAIILANIGTSKSMTVEEQSLVVQWVSAISQPLVLSSLPRPMQPIIQKLQTTPLETHDTSKNWFPQGILTQSGIYVEDDRGRHYYGGDITASATYGYRRGKAAEIDALGLQWERTEQPARSRPSFSISSASSSEQAQQAQVDIISQLLEDKNREFLDLQRQMEHLRWENQQLKALLSQHSPLSPTRRSREQASPTYSSMSSPTSPLHFRLPRAASQGSATDRAESPKSLINQGM